MTPKPTPIGVTGADDGGALLAVDLLRELGTAPKRITNEEEAAYIRQRGGLIIRVWRTGVPTPQGLALPDVWVENDARADDLKAALERVLKQHREGFANAAAQ